MFEGRADVCYLLGDGMAGLWAVGRGHPQSWHELPLRYMLDTISTLLRWPAWRGDEGSCIVAGCFSTKRYLDGSWKPHLTIMPSWMRQPG